MFHFFLFILCEYRSIDLIRSPPICKSLFCMRLFLLLSCTYVRNIYENYFCYLNTFDIWIEIYWILCLVCHLYLYYHLYSYLYFHLYLFLYLSCHWLPLLDWTLPPPSTSFPSSFSPLEFNSIWEADCWLWYKIEKENEDKII